MPQGFYSIVGDDGLILPVMALGGTGVISVAANIIPKDTAALVDAVAKKDMKTAEAINAKFQPLVSALFIETNPIPVKTAMALMGLCNGALRLPMCEMEDANLAKLKTALKNYGLLK